MAERGGRRRAGRSASERRLAPFIAAGGTGPARPSAPRPARSVLLRTPLASPAPQAWAASPHLAWEVGGDAGLGVLMRKVEERGV